MYYRRFVQWYSKQNTKQFNTISLPTLFLHNYFYNTCNTPADLLNNRLALSLSEPIKISMFGNSKKMFLFAMFSYILIGRRLHATLHVVKVVDKLY